MDVSLLIANPLSRGQARSAFRRRLLDWFDRVQRELPWRSDPQPYHVWLSEIMLQQTQVATVIPYFHRFVARFPTITALAQAELADVLKLWEGLGYYRRAKALHAAARMMVARHDGVVPDDPQALAELPGIGRYTLGAILSQAFELPWPVVDANVQRVFCRLFAWEGVPSSQATQQWLWATAEALLPRMRVGDFNQALMELGALTCRARQPQCHQCPVAKWCQAHRQGRQHEFPKKSKAPTPAVVTEVAIVVARRQRYLLVQRPARATRWADMWETPHVEAIAPTAETALATLTQLTGLTATEAQPLPSVRHGITRFDVTLHCWLTRGIQGRFRSLFYQAYRWLTLAEVDKLPLSTPQRRIFREVASSAGG